MSSSTSSEVVVRTRHLGKAYQLYAHRSDWLKQVVFGTWKTYYKPFWVLRDIDLDVYRGDSIGWRRCWRSAPRSTPSCRAARTS
jgi:lipopolysaccharide transport system ATP-binding protein